MEIRFTRNGIRNHIISCSRKDGSVTWMHSDPFFIMHDLCHYAVETGLGLKHAFYGMLAAGTDIKDFELPKEQRTFELTEEALFAEQLVNLLAIEWNQGRLENFMDTFQKATRPGGFNNKLLFIEPSKLETIRTEFELLMTRWQQLPEKETITLIFEE